MYAAASGPAGVDRASCARGARLHPEFRTIVEFDGLTKYVSADDLVAEKAREDRLRALGYQIVRVIWGEFPTAPADRIRQAFARAR